MQRRKFVQDSSLIALSVGVFGKIRWNGNAYVGEDATTTDILGPFYRPGAPLRTDLVQKGNTGEVIHFNGTIFEKDGKTPAKNALMEIWHCDEKGVYDNTSDDYIYRAAWKTEGDGKYHFKTIQPVPYNAGPTQVRPAHIHLRVSNTGEQDLVTQIYFKGDKYIPGDSSSADPRSLNRILDISKNAAGEKIVNFDIVLKDGYKLENSAFNKLEGLYSMSDNTACEFYKKGNELFVKLNGQIMEAMEYKGNNCFEGGLGFIKTQFELLEQGKVKVKLSYAGDNGKVVTIDGNKMLKYPA